MEEGCTVGSNLLLLITIVMILFQPSNQRPPCSRQADCGQDTSERGFNSKYLSMFEDPAAVKQLLESLLMQHNEYVEAAEANEDEYLTETPPIESSYIGVIEDRKTANVEHIGIYGRNKTKQDVIDKPPSSEAIITTINETDDNKTTRKNAKVTNSTEGQPSIRNNFTSTISENSTDANSVDSLWEITTIQPQQLVSLLDFNEPHLETTTPQPGHVVKFMPSGSSFKSADGAFHPAIDPMKEDSYSSYLANTLPSKVNKKQTGKTTTTWRPFHVVSSGSVAKPPQQLSTNELGFQTKPYEKMDSLMTSDRKQFQDDHHVRGGIKLETLNHPISKGKPEATNVTTTIYEPIHHRERSRNATSSIVSETTRKAINIKSPQLEANNQKLEPGKKINSTNKSRDSGIPNPSTAKPVATTSSESDDYLISAQASIASEEENIAEHEHPNINEEDGEEDDDDEDEYEEGDDSNKNIVVRHTDEIVKETSDKKNDDEDDEEQGEREAENDGGEDDYLTDSTEEDAEHNSLDYIGQNNASDVISTDM